MLLEKLPLDQWPVIPNTNILDDIVDIYYTENCRKKYLESVKNCLFHFVRNKKALLITIGESFTWGETLPIVNKNLPYSHQSLASVKGYFDLGSQLKHLYGGHVSRGLDTDWLQYAVPGNCNVNMLLTLPEILDYVQQFNYEKIYLSVQLTDILRDTQTCMGTPLADCYIGVGNNDKFIRKYNSSKIHVYDWLKLTHETILNWLQSILNNYNNLNIETLVYNNFVDWNTDKRDYSFKLLEDSMVKYCTEYVNCTYRNLKVINPQLVELLCRHDYCQIVIFEDEIKKQFLDNIEWYYDSINAKLAENSAISTLLCPHPTVLGHEVWSKNLLGYYKG